MLSSDSTSHAVSLAAIIRAIGGVPCWTVWNPPDNGTLIPLFEIQLARERICRNLYAKAAQLLEGSPLASWCAALEQDENRHIELVERIITSLMEKAGLKPEAPDSQFNIDAGVLFIEPASA